VDEWRAGVEQIVGDIERKFGVKSQALRSHSCIFPGWDESPVIFADNGLRLDTNFLNGYRYQSGYANGSALPARFVDRNGTLLDCWEQSTVHGDDVLCGTKCMLPPYSQDECTELSRATIRELAETYHGVYHPYFHPLYLGGRGAIPTAEWFVEVLRAGKRHGLPSLNAEEWLAFNDARRSVVMDRVTWDPESGELQAVLRADESAEGMTVMLPAIEGRSARTVTLDGEQLAARPLPYEGLGWTAVDLKLSAGDEKQLTVRYDADTQ